MLNLNFTYKTRYLFLFFFCMKENWVWLDSSPQDVMAKCPFTLHWWGQIPMEIHCNWLHTKLLYMHGDIWKHAGHFYHLIDCPGGYSNHRQSGSIFPAVLLEVGSRRKIQSKDRVKCWLGIQCSPFMLIGWSWRGVDHNKVGMSRVLRSLC